MELIIYEDMRHCLAFYVVFILSSFLTEAKTVLLKSSPGNQMLTQDMFIEDGVRYKLSGYFDLNGESIIIPPESTLYIENGSVNHGELIITDGVTIEANGSEWRQVRIISQNARDITITDLSMNGEQTTSMHNIFRFMYCSNITLNNIHTSDYYRKYRGPDVEQQNDNGFLWYPFLCKNCDNISIDGYSSERTYPEGPFFINCKNVKIAHMNVSDQDNLNKYDIWTPLNIFYCSNVSISQSIFVRRSSATKSGSTANLCCNNLSMVDCYFEGGSGVDFSNEWFDKEFKQSDILLEHCTIVKSTKGIYTQPSPQIIENITIRNSYIQSSATKDVYGFTFSTGNIKNLSCYDCHFSGLIFLQFSADKEYSGKIGDCLFSNCMFDDDFYGDYTGPQGPILVRNSSADVNVGVVTFEKCSFNYHRYIARLAANAGSYLKVVIKDSDFDIKSLDISGNYNSYDLEFINNKVFSESYYLNIVQGHLGNAIIQGNEFENQAFLLQYSSLPRTFQNNSFKGLNGKKPIIINKASNVVSLSNSSR